MARCAPVPNALAATSTPCLPASRHVRATYDQPIGSEADTSRDGVPHPGNIAHRRGAEEPLIFAGKVRGIVIPDAGAGARRIKVLAEHQPAGLLEPQLLLELPRAHRRDRLEVVVEARHAHPHRLRELL